MSKKSVVLVVDDDNDYRKMLVRWLKSEYEVYEACAGVELLQNLILIKPDVIILDVMLPWQINEMPDIIGGYLLGMIRKVNPNIQVIMITGTVVEDGRFILQAFEKGAVSFLLKDKVNYEDLKYKIKNALLKKEKFLSHLKEKSLIEIIKLKFELDDILKEKFTHTYTFFDIDLAKSTNMLENESDINVIYSFYEYHNYVKKIVFEHKGEILDSVGDELMCYFKNPNDAIDAGISILEGLEKFNKERNRLKKDFQVRIGIHTGEIILDKAEGIAFDEVLHITGHLQKNADTNGILISEETYGIIEKKNKFHDAKELPEDRIRAFSYKSPKIERGENKK